MSEKNVTLISKDYIDSNFITTSDERVTVNKTETGYDLALNGSFIERDEYTDLENKVDGKQDTLVAGPAINIAGSTISVRTAAEVGTSALPVTASAVNKKLNSYVTTILPADSSITVDRSEGVVTLKANGGGGDVDIESLLEKLKSSHFILNICGITEASWSNYANGLRNKLKTIEFFNGIQYLGSNGTVCRLTEYDDWSQQDIPTSETIEVIFYSNDQEHRTTLETVVNTINSYRPDPNWGIVRAGLPLVSYRA